MSDTYKAGKRSYRKVGYKPHNRTEQDAISSRHTFGRTEKILRRCRKIWTRLLNKRRRQADKDTVARELNGR